MKNRDEHEHSNRETTENTAGHNRNMIGTQQKHNGNATETQ